MLHLIGDKAKYFESDPINDKVKNNVENYEGFYVSRFPIGIEGGILSDSDNNERLTNWTKWKNGKPVSKKGSKVWNNITQEKAKEISSDFININTTHSYLITSYCYDTILEWLNRNINDFKTNTIYGTYSKEEKENYSEVLTGNNENRKLNNIYDIVGLDEFTTEYTSTSQSESFPVSRGSRILYRENVTSNNENTDFQWHYLFRKIYNIPSSNGWLVFRTILYIE